MYNSISLDDATGSAVLLHRTTRRVIQRTEGLTGLAGPRQAIRDRPQAHGAINDSRWQSGQTMVLEGILKDSSSALLEAEWDAIAGAAYDTLTAPTLLKWETETGRQLQRLAKLNGDFLPALDASKPNIWNYQLQLLAEDPRAYSQTLTTAIGSALSSSGGGMIFPELIPVLFSPTTAGAVAVNNIGTRPTPPTFRVYGQVDDAQIVLSGTNYRISLIGSIPAGSYLDIDVQARTLKMNGITPYQSLLDSANTTWFDLPRGTSTIQMVAGSFDAVARCDVIYRSAY